MVFYDWGYGMFSHNYSSIDEIMQNFCEDIKVCGVSSDFEHTTETKKTFPQGKINLKTNSILN
ncbi:hypothetical protein DRN38_01185 [Thermococci archaeon]|nr:MAG: hypothetical protein DRN38_01185 [Thermococci archaeon]